MERIEFRAMGCQMLALVDDDGARAAGALQQVPGWFAAWEQCFSRFLAGSELNRLNNGAGQWQVVSPELWDVFQLSVDASRQTGGLITPATLDALEAAGYDRSFELLAEGGARTAVAQRPARAALPDWSGVDWDARRRALYLPPGLRLDFGGLVKGWAADEAARRLSACGPALVDAGGDIALSGPRAGGGAWPVEIEHAGGAAAPAGEQWLLLLHGGGVATSGRDYRRWQQHGVWQHHIIDPRTGSPAQTEVLTATVTAPSAHAAEVAAKYLFLLGETPGLAWLANRAQFAGLLQFADGHSARSANLASQLWEG